MATEAPARIPEAAIGPVEQRDLPEAPPLRRMIGPSVILVGVGIASGEFILWPFIASQVGLVFLWAAIVGLLTQYFINMEVERYTLATGETAITGFQRLWRPFGLVMVACAIIPNMWPGWVISAATITTFMTGGGDPNVIAIAALFAIGIALSASPVVYQTIEKLEFVKVALVLLFLVVALTTAITAAGWSDASQIVTEFGTFPTDDLEWAVLLGALAYAGAGGTNNLVLSNWIRDKGYGMGFYAPRVVSPITGSEEAEPSGRGYVFTPDEENMGRWQEWWRKANIEQFFSFFVIGAITIVVFSLVAYSTVFGHPDAQEDNFDFVQLEGTVLKEEVGTWFGTLFWLIGAISLFGAALGIIDYVSRLVADVLRVGYLRDSTRWTESRLYFVIVWGIILFGTAVLLSGFDQPLSLIVLSAALSGGAMFIYSALLIVINRRFMPEPLKIRGIRLAVLAFAFCLFGVMSVLVVINEAAG
ncbi:MAG TPA: Nramp family divalent metal transporter [Solirubrobacteraceae bacterium]|nr:Nramp family divalent metal transporter [Solirubrobacteraceae bacterium]